MGRFRVAVVLPLLTGNVFAYAALAAGDANGSDAERTELEAVPAPMPSPEAATAPAAVASPTPRAESGAPTPNATSSLPTSTSSPPTSTSSPPSSPATQVAYTEPPLSTQLSVSDTSTSPDDFTHTKWVLGVDRLSMIGAWSVEHTTFDGIHVSENGTQATLIGGGASTGATIPINPVAIPRLFVDRIARNRFTVGFGASLYKTSGGWDAERSNQTATRDGQHSWLYAISPRLGYLIPVTEAAAIWARAGVTWSQQQSRIPLMQSRSSVGTLDFSLAGVFRVVKPLAISLALDLSLPLGGVTYVDYDQGLANRSGVSSHQQIDAGLRMLALQLGALFYQ